MINNHTISKKLTYPTCVTDDTRREIFYFDVA